MPLQKWDQQPSKKLSLTLDTNCVIAIGKDEHVDKLMNLKDANLIDIFKTDVVDTELKNTSSRPKSASLVEDIGVAVIGSSRIGHSKIGGGESQSFHEEILHLLFPGTKGQSPTKNQTRDAMHIITHRDHKRDFYITNDNDFLLKKEELKTKYSINVMSPKECTEYLEKELGK